MSNTKRISKRRPTSVRMKRSDTGVPVRSGRLPASAPAVKPVRMDRVIETRERLNTLDVDAQIERAVRIMVERELD